MEPFLKEVLKKLGLRNIRALDIGCGKGTDSIYMASLGFEVLGLDLCQKPIDIANQRVRRMKNPPKFKYPHKFKVGDLIVPKINVNMGPLDNSPAVIVEFDILDGVERVKIMFQNTGRVATYNIATLVMLFNKLV